MPVNRTVNFDWAKPHRDNDPYGVDVPNLAATIDGIDTVMQAVKVLADGAATQADIDTAIAALVGAAPETLNALNELAAALGNDPDFATTMAEQLGLKATKVELQAAVAALNDAIALKADAETTNTRFNALETADLTARQIALAIAYTGAR